MWPAPSSVKHVWPVSQLPSLAQGMVQKLLPLASSLAQKLAAPQSASAPQGEHSGTTRASFPPASSPDGYFAPQPHTAIDSTTKAHARIRTSCERVVQRLCQS